MSEKIVRTYDIVNAGPRNRFMLNGRIVSNSGRGMQPQNLPRGTMDQTDELLQCVDTGDWRVLKEKFQDPIGALSSCIRGMIRAPQGYKFLVTDFANIEGRVNAWVSGEAAALEVFRSGLDIYKEMAADIFGVKIEDVTKDQRFLGKVAILGLGYNMGAPKFQSTCASYGLDIDLDFAQRVVDIYRAKYKHIVQYWKTCQDAAVKAILTGKPQEAGPVTFFIQGPFLKIRLPSGRCLHYYKPRVVDEETQWGSKRKRIVFMGVNSQTRQWQEQDTYGGKLVENIVQAISRDIMCFAWANAEKRRFPMVMLVHDELVSEVPNSNRWTIDDFNDIISQNPPWAPDLPLAVEGFECVNYTK